jgi:chemotaxis protein methyltransferase CheR
MNTLIPHISEEILGQLSQRISTEMGLDYPPDRWRDMRRGIQGAISELGFRSELEAVRALASHPFSPEQIDVLAAHLTIGETYFWREPNTLAALHEQILPPLIHERRATTRHLKIWSAACSSGEEPYSIAILLDRLIPDMASWNITIQATDINREVLSKAKTGVYGQWSFRGTPTVIKERYFRQVGGRSEIVPEIRQMVKFAYLNLAQDMAATAASAPNYDIILCRNVLIYMGGTRVQQVISHMSECLNPEGWFVVSPVETSLVQTAQLRAINFREATLFQKAPRREALAPPVVRPAPTVPRVLAKPSFSGPERRANTRVVPPRAAPTPSKLAGASREWPLRSLSPVQERGTLSARPNVPAPPEPSARDLYLRARDYANTGRLSEALEWCDKSLQADRLVPEVHYLRASILQEQGNVEMALQALQRVAYLDPQFIMAHFSLGNLMLQCGKTNEARLQFNHALQLLKAYPVEELIPESEGLRAGQLLEIITAM